MKKAFIVAALILALAVPAMAADLSVSGAARFRGFHQDNTMLDPNAEESRAWYDFRIRPVFTIKVNDNISLVTRVRIFNNDRFGNNNTTIKAGGAAAAAGKNDLASWDRGWVNVKTPYGLFQTGRMTGGVWGLDINDVEAAADRVRFTMQFGNLTVLPIIEKVQENDVLANYNTVAGNLQSDLDVDAYHLGLVYKMENITMGLLSSHSRNAAVAAQLTQQYIFQPYFTAKFGNFGLMGEGRIITGSTKFTTNNQGATAADNDISGHNLFLAGSATFGPIGLQIGYAMGSGDSDPADTKTENGAAWGTEYTPLVVMTDVDNYINLATITPLGYHVFFGQIDYNLTDSIKLTALGATAKVDENRAFTTDSIGREFDLKLLWKAMPNLTYEVLWGYFWAGDIWKNAGSRAAAGAAGGAALANVDDTWTLYHKLEITF